MTHWKKIVKPDAPYFGEADFDSVYQTFLVTIDHCSTERITNEQGTQLKGVLHFRERIKPLILNVTNGKRIAELYGKDIDGWVGKQITLYYDPSVRVAGKTVGGTRVKAPVIVREKPPKCESCGADISPAGRMTAAQTAEYTFKKYGRRLCAECATKVNQNQTEEHENAE